MEIRPFEPADEDAVIALLSAVFAHPAPHNDPATITNPYLETDYDNLLYVCIPCNLA